MLVGGGVVARSTGALAAGAAVAGSATALSTGGRQMLQALYLEVASFSIIEIWLRLSERQPAR